MLKRVRRLVIAGGLAIFSAAGGGTAAAPAGDEAAIRSTLERWTEDFNARRQTAVCPLFAPDLVASYRGQPERGYADICRLLTESLGDARRSYHYALRLQEIIVSGDIAVVRLVWTLTIDDRISPPVRLDEPGLDVFRRQPDGSWKIIRYLAYPVER